MLRPSPARPGFSPAQESKLDLWSSLSRSSRDWRDASVSCRSTQLQDPKPAAAVQRNSGGNGQNDKPLDSATRLQQLREARLRSEARLRRLQSRENTEKLGGGGSHADLNLVSTVKTVDRRVYDQVSASRNRLSQQLSSKNRYIRHLEAMLEERTEVVGSAHKAILRVSAELDSIKRLSEVAIAAAAFGVDKAEAVARSERIIKRAQSLQDGILKEAKVMDRLVVRKVPIVWYGVASEVKIMGEFDNWTEGYSLSPEEIQDQTFTKFRADVPLLPGSYKVKFKVDDAHWRLAPDWPTEDDSEGSTNNILRVE